MLLNKVHALVGVVTSKYYAAHGLIYLRGHCGLLETTPTKAGMQLFVRKYVPLTMTPFFLPNTYSVFTNKYYLAKKCAVGAKYR